MFSAVHHTRCCHGSKQAWQLCRKKEKKRKEGKGRVTFQVTNMLLHSLEGYRTMRGMRLMLINLWPFPGALICSWVLRRWGKAGTCCRNRAAFPPPQIWLHLGFTELQTTNANVKHFLRGTLYNCRERTWVSGPHLSLLQSHYTPISCYCDGFTSAKTRRTSVNGVISRHALLLFNVSVTLVPLRKTNPV